MLLSCSLLYTDTAWVAVAIRKISSTRTPSSSVAQTKSAQVFNDDITGPEGSAIEVFTATNGSFDDPFGNFTLRYGANDTTGPLPFDATADEVEGALEVREIVEPNPQ